MKVMWSGRGRKETDTLAAQMAAASAGGITSLKTTVAVTSKDAMKSMRAAKKIQAGFKPAGSE